MSVIRHPVDDESGAAQFAGDAAHVGEQFALYLCADEGFAIFGAEDDVRDQVRVSVRHLMRAFALCSYFSALVSYAPPGLTINNHHDSPGSRQGLSSNAPTGLAFDRLSTTDYRLPATIHRRHRRKN